jgi:hypothetical protein
VASSTCLVHFGARGMAHLYGTHLVEGPLTNGLPTSKKRSRRFTSRVTPMRTVVLMCAVSRTAAQAKAGHWHTGQLRPSAGRFPMQPRAVPDRAQQHSRANSRFFSRHVEHVYV